MIEYVKVQKGNEVKSIDKGLLRQYITAGWKEVKKEQTAPTTSAYSSTPYTSTVNK